ncbi:MAG: response regulator [Candidatus Omnitrophica bacterium]|nr:response regulator [Candidatus Omnitrophota bacterium]
MNTILCVDDEEHVLKALERALVTRGYRVLTTTSAQEAMALLNQCEVSVIIADQKMPGLSGIDLLRWCRKNFPQVHRIILTGFVDWPELITAVNECGIFKYLPKPWDNAELLAFIEEALVIEEERHKEQFFLEMLKKENQNLRKERGK